MEFFAKKFIVGPLSTNAYVVYENTTKNAVIIDPGYKDPSLLQFIEKESLNVKVVILTHGHFDHIMGLDTLWERFKPPVYIHKNDADMLFDPRKNHSAHFGIPFSFKGTVEEICKEQVLSLDPFEIKILETPGHTSGSISLLVGNFLFTGDTLFVGAIGRTDFPESQPEKMKESLEKLLSLGDDLIVHPGHMGSAKLGLIKEKFW